MIRHAQAEAKQVDYGADQALGLPVGQAEHRAQREGQYQGCPPRVVRGSAAQAAIASSGNHTVRLPRKRRLAS